MINLILALICNTLFRFAPFDFSFGRPEEFHTSYAVGQAASYLFLLNFAKDNIKSWSTSTVIVFDIVFWCAVSNLMDELFGNPLKLGYNEVFFAIFIVIWTVDKHVRRKNMSEAK